MPFAAALSTAAETAVAFAAVANEVQDRVPAPELGVVFYSPHHLGEVEVFAKRLHDKLGVKALIGCVGEAIVGGGREVEHEPAVTLWLGSWGGAVAIDPV